MSHAISQAHHSRDLDGFRSRSAASGPVHPTTSFADMLRGDSNMASQTDRAFSFSDTGVFGRRGAVAGYELQSSGQSTHPEKTPESAKLSACLVSRSLAGEAAGQSLPGTYPVPARVAADRTGLLAELSRVCDDVLSAVRPEPGIATARTRVSIRPELPAGPDSVKFLTRYISRNRNHPALSVTLYIDGDEAKIAIASGTGASSPDQRSRILSRISRLLEEKGLTLAEVSMDGFRIYSGGLMNGAVYGNFRR